MATPEIVILWSRPEDAALVAPRLRAWDASELVAATNLSPFLAVQQAIEKADASWTVYADGRAACLFGLIWLGYWCPWFIGTTLVESQPVLFTRTARAIVKIFAARCGVVAAWVNDAWTQAVGWAAALGFEPDGHYQEALSSYTRYARRCE